MTIPIPQTHTREGTSMSRSYVARIAAKNTRPYMTIGQALQFPFIAYSDDIPQDDIAYLVLWSETKQTLSGDTLACVARICSIQRNYHTIDMSYTMEVEFLDRTRERYTIDSYILNYRIDSIGINNQDKDNPCLLVDSKQAILFAQAINNGALLSPHSVPSALPLEALHRFNSDTYADIVDIVLSLHTQHAIDIDSLRLVEHTHNDNLAISLSVAIAGKDIIYPLAISMSDIAENNRNMRLAMEKHMLDALHELGYC